jgi:hypothetical protein
MNIERNLKRTCCGRGLVDSGMTLSYLTISSLNDNHSNWY